VQKIHVRVAAVVAAALVPLALVTTQAPAGADAAAPSPVVRVATFNVQVRRSLDEFRAGVVPLLDRSDLIGLQEMDRPEKNDFLATLSASGWDHFAVMPSRQEPVLWRADRFTFVSGRVEQVSAAANIGSEATSGLLQYQKPRSVTVVRLFDRYTGRNVSVINAHLIQGAVRGGRPWVGRPRVWGIYKRSLARLAAINAFEKTWGDTFVVGDFNSGWVEDRRVLRKRMPIRTFGRQGLRSMWATVRPAKGIGTHNDALIDQIFSGIAPLGTAIQFDIAGVSDHLPAIATYPTT
jgi:endonuclease/exonuclease/phosphatase family metal-dependent hydrolase